MKPTQNFKMKKSAKRLLATIVDSDLRNAVKACFIQAQLQSEIVPQTKERKQ